MDTVNPRSLGNTGVLVTSTLTLRIEILCCKYSSHDLGYVHGVLGLKGCILLHIYKCTGPSIHYSRHSLRVYGVGFRV